MIPKIIHYTWFGPKPLPMRYRRYIKGWLKLMPDYRLMEWNNSHLLQEVEYINKARNAGCWANLSNLMRLYALSVHGGIYLDVDVEVIKKFDSLLTEECFLGFEDTFEWAGCVNNAILGAVPGHWFINKLLNKLITNFDGTEEAHLSSPNMTTALLKELGMKCYQEQNIEGVKIFLIDYFYPYSWHRTFKIKDITEQSYCIHWYDKTWSDKKNKAKIVYAWEFFPKIAWQIKKLFQT
jgi:mannosyltransferase OCH1-like enzyme